MNKSLLYGAAAVGAVLAYRYLAERIVTADFMGYEILAKKGYFFARDKTTRKVSLDMPSILTVQQWIGAQKAASSIRGWIPGMGDDLLLPSEGRTITASGQVLNGLGSMTTYQDAYDATPSQYRRDAINDFVPGIGDLSGRFSRVVRRVSNVVQSVVKAPAIIAAQAVKITRPVLKPLSVMDPISASTRLGLSTMKVLTKAITNPAGAFKMIRGAVKSFTITPLKQAGMMVGIVKKPKVVETDAGQEYQDANGNAISKEDYDRLMTLTQESVPKKATDYKGYSIWTAKNIDPNGSGGVLYLINYDAAQNSAEGAYPSMAEAQAAIDAVSIPATQPDPADTPKDVIAPPPPSNYEATKRNYDIMQAERESSSIQSNTTSSDYGSSTTSDDSGYGRTQISEEGAPALPERITSVQAPSADMLPPPGPAAPDTKKGNTAVGVVVGGGILAAIAAAAMS